MHIDLSCWWSSLGWHISFHVCVPRTSIVTHYVILKVEVGRSWATQYGIRYVRFLQHWDLPYIRQFMLCLYDIICLSVFWNCPGSAIPDFHITWTPRGRQCCSISKWDVTYHSAFFGGWSPWCLKTEWFYGGIFHGFSITDQYNYTYIYTIIYIYI